MKNERGPLQGVLNIVRFNWHFYVLFFVIFGLCLLMVIHWATFLASYVWLKMAIWLGLAAAATSTFMSLAISWYVYDKSGLYNLKWLDDFKLPSKGFFLNIHAGFDETSVLLQAKFPAATLQVLDFYDPIKHTEVSIKRARAAYPPYPNTQHVRTEHLPYADESVSLAFAIFSAHEVRDEAERLLFFKEIRRVLAPNTQLVLVEHLRDWPNFIAYSIGFLHFYSLSNWQSTFKGSGWRIVTQKNLTPFVKCFLLEAHAHSN